MAYTVTNAPVDYDGFGTETVSEMDEPTFGAVRVVETPDEHTQWQRDRYASGLYLYADKDQATNMGLVLGV